MLNDFTIDNDIDIDRDETMIQPDTEVFDPVTQPEKLQIADTKDVTLYSTGRSECGKCPNFNLYKYATNIKIVSDITRKRAS